MLSRKLVKSNLLKYKHTSWIITKYLGNSRNMRSFRYFKAKNKLWVNSSFLRLTEYGCKTIFLIRLSYVVIFFKWPTTELVRERAINKNAVYIQVFVMLHFNNSRVQHTITSSLAWPKTQCLSRSAHWEKILMFTYFLYTYVWCTYCNCSVISVFILPHLQAQWDLEFHGVINAFDHTLSTFSYFARHSLNQIRI